MPDAPNQFADRLAEGRDQLRTASRIVAFTGSGISAESGIPTFRDAGGLWDRAPVETFGTPWGIAQTARTAPRRLAGILAEVGDVVLSAEPNAAHRTLATLEHQRRLLGVVTQNVDDLHERAGSEVVHKLHGDLFRWRCTACGATRVVERWEVRDVLAAASRAHTGTELKAAAPTCFGCAGMERPDIVLFGEMLPESAVEQSVQLMKVADALLVIGTSGAVEPAAGFARRSAARGIPVIEINLEPSDLSAVATTTILGPAGEVLPSLLETGE